MKSIMQQTAEHIEMERTKDQENFGGGCEYIINTTCPVCGKNFIPAAFHVYKDNRGKKVCSYSCQLKTEPKVRMKKWGG